MSLCKKCLHHTYVIIYDKQLPAEIYILYCKKKKRIIDEDVKECGDFEPMFSRGLDRWFKFSCLTGVRFDNRSR